MASGVRTVTEHPGCPGCRSRRGRGVPAPPPRPDPLPSPPAVALGRSGWHRAPAPGKGLLLGWGPAGPHPSRKGSSWLFYKYIYIYIFCSKVLLPHVRAGAPRTARIPTPGLSPGSARGAPGPPRGSRSRTSPAGALPVPVAVSTAKLFTLFFSDVIFKTSDIACLPGHRWQ